MSERPDRGDVAPVLAAVFVYGTLRPGRANWSVAANWCTRHEPATLPGYALYALDYPCAVPVGAQGPMDAAASSVKGDLLWLEPSGAIDAITRLDAFEGFVPSEPDRSYYRRIGAEVIASGDVRHHVWVYVPGDDLLRLVDAGRRVPGDDWPA